jgi:halocyanin-like protein
MSESDPTGSTAPTRRGFLRTATAGAATAALGAGATGTAVAQSDFDGYLDDVSNYDGTVVDATGQDSVEITVGAQGNNGNFAYGPPAVRVDPGTEVVWQWNGQGGAHNVVGENRDFTSGSAVAEAGTTYTRTFEEEGVVKYFCTPHKSLGMKGVVVVGGSGGGGGGPTPIPADFDGYLDDTDNYDGTVVDERGSDEVTITVGAQGNGGNFAYDPPAVRISPGTTVVWEWNGQGGAHNVVGENRDFTSGEAVAEAGTTYERTFEETGVVTYYCTPHKSLGMKGGLIVDPAEPGAGGGEGGGEEEGGQLVFTPALRAFGVAIVLGVLSPIVFAVVTMWRRGEIGSQPEPAGGGGLQRVELTPDLVTAEAEEVEPEREIEHDAFDPTGTAGLIIVYFAIISLLWVFMYFVEFLGNGPTIIG